MRKTWLLCVLLGAIAWGQAAPSTPPPAQPAVVGGHLPTPGAAKPAMPAAQADSSAAVPDNAAVITIKGVCAPQPKTTAAKGAAAKAATKTAAADCKTVYTKKEFETLLKGVPNGSANPQIKKNVAARLPGFVAWSTEAKKKGLDKTPEFAAMMKFERMAILAAEMQQKVQEDAAKVSDAEIADYYKKNPEAYRQYSLERFFVPRSKQVTADAKKEKDEDEEKEEHEKKDEKPTADQLKAKQAEEKAKQEENEQAMTKLAESLHARAAAGEDFATLQKEAFEAAGMKIPPPNVSMPNVRRTGLSPAHASVFDLKPGEVSEVINDAGGHYIYKMKGSQEMSLDQVKDEIRRILQSQHMRDMMDKVNNSFQVEKNEAYFGPEGPAMPPQRMNPRMMAPPGAPPAQPQTPPQAAPPPPPPAQPPAPKPN